MPVGGRISGLAIAAGGAGFVLLLSAYKNRSITDTLRAVLRNEKLAPSSGLAGTEVQAITAGSGTATGAAVAATAQSYVGKVRYRWAGADPTGWDCSGFVTWVLHHDHGIDLPSNTHTVAAVFYAWPGATDVPRSDCQPGDLVCWVSHIGIAISKDQMVHAPTAGQLTQVSNIWSVPKPVIRRPKAYAAAVNVEAFR